LFKIETVQTVTKTDFQTAFAHTIQSLLYPKWIQTIKSREKYFFQMDDLCNQNMECIKLVSVELTESSKIKLKFEPFFAKKLTYSTDSADSTEFFNIHFKPVPNFREIQINSFHSDLSQLNSHGFTRKMIFDYWRTNYRIRLPLQDDETGNSDNMCFCELDNGEIYPFCMLMRDFKEVNEITEKFLVKFLIDVKRHVERIGLTDESKLTLSNVESSSGCPKLTVENLSILNNYSKLTPLNTETANALLNKIKTKR
jgi:hypothetical protein